MRIKKKSGTLNPRRGAAGLRDFIKGVKLEIVDTGRGVGVDEQ